MAAIAAWHMFCFVMVLINLIFMQMHSTVDVTMHLKLRFCSLFLSQACVTLPNTCTCVHELFIIFLYKFLGCKADGNICSCVKWVYTQC
jgi:hypothetical protein